MDGNYPATALNNGNSKPYLLALHNDESVEGLVRTPVLM